MTRYAMVIDTKKCVGCQACTVACQAEWGLPPGERFCRVESREEGKFPNVTRQIIPIQCMHCANAPCIDVCPTKASYRREDGIVLVDEKRCAGCKYCMVACPYQARVMNHDSGVPEKCRFCYHRLGEGKEPACVNTCIGNARVFGDLDNPDSEVAKLGPAKSPTAAGRPRHQTFNLLCEVIRMQFGWIIAVYLFLAGAGAGAFITGVWARLRDRDGRLSAVTRAGTLLGAPLATLGILFLVLDLGWVEAGKFEPWRLLYLYTNPSSMITWGTWILTFFIPISFLYGLAQTGLDFSGKAFFSSRLAGCLSTIFAFGTAVYTGILLGVVKAVPLWNNSVLPILFLVSALSTGLAAALIGATLVDKAVSARLHVFKPVHITLVSSELLLIFVLLFISAKSSQVSGASVEMLVSGAYSLLFWLGVIVAGLALPLALQFFPAAPAAKTVPASGGGEPLAVGKSALTVHEAAYSGKGLIILEGVLVLAGGFILRYLILAAGLPVNLF